jgi:hypothetical protein
MSNSRVRKGPAGVDRGIGKKYLLDPLKNWAKYDCGAVWGRRTLFVWGG